MRRSLTRSGVESQERALRKELQGLDERENNLVDAIARLGLGDARLTGRFREELDRIQEDRQSVEALLSELPDVQEQARRLREIPRLVEDYLKDLPYLLDPITAVPREYETVPNERTPENPFGVYTLTPERIRHKEDAELEADRRGSLEARRQAFREVYTALRLTVVCYKDGGLEIRWSGGCSEWHRGSAGCCTA